jgi:OPA family glycerol-3-phosphate transporter-like MFS transporter 3
MTNWFSDSRGFIIGLWATNSNVGNVLGSAFSGVFESNNMGAPAIMAFHAFLLFAIACLVWLFLNPKPGPIVVAEDQHVESQQELRPLQATELHPSRAMSHEPIGICRALLIPGVVEYSISYACVKVEVVLLT